MDFLGPKQVAQLLHAAASGPIVVLNAHKNGCDALVLVAHTDKVMHIPLSLRFTLAKAAELVESLGKAQYGRSIARDTNSTDRHIQIKGRVRRDPEDLMKGLLAELWDMVVKPVLVVLAIPVS